MSGTPGPGEGNPPATPPATPPGTPPSDGRIVFDSQAALDASLADRLGRKEAATRKALAEKLGVTAEQLDERITALTKLEKDSLTESERKVVEAREAAVTETEARVTASFTTKIDAANLALKKAAVIRQAQESGFRHPEDVWDRVREDTTITIDAETFEVKGHDKAVKKVADDRPDWVGNATPPIFRGSPPGGGGGPATAQRQMQALEQTMLERSGRLSGGRRSRL